VRDAADGPAVFTPADDGLHTHLAGDEWWFTETSWFAFHDVEHHLGGWFYTMIRPNIGTVAGGAWVWDDTAHLPWEVPYSANYTSLPLPPDLDLRDARLPNGVRIQVEVPTMAYRLGYDDPGRFTADLRFDATMAPRALATGASTFGHAAHFDQLGHVTGSIELHSRRIDIDCWSMRDRTWGRRPENRPRQAAYVTGAGAGGRGFLAVTNTREGRDTVAYGFAERDGEPVTLIDGERTVVRNVDTGWVERIRIEAIDANGRAFVADGRSTNRIIVNRHTFIDVNSVIHWHTVDGQSADWWGEDQDMWPVHRWSAARRSSDWSTAS
jgi:hypothetical protein